MSIKNVNDVPGIDMGPKLPGVTMQVLIGPDEGAGNFVMRRFTLAPGAATPHHDHEWEHEAFILEGTGVLVNVENLGMLVNVRFPEPGSLYNTI